MTASPFKHFNPEKLNSPEADNEPIAGSHAITQWVRRAAITCAPGGRISNAEIARLIEHVQDYDAPNAPRQITPQDFYSNYPESLSHDDIPRERYDAARALLLIDEAIGVELVTSKNMNVLDRLLLAAAWVSDADERVADTQKMKAVNDIQTKLKRSTKKATSSPKRVNGEAAAKALKNAARAYYIDNGMHNIKALSAANALSKKFNIKEKRAQDWITEWRKQDAALEFYKAYNLCEFSDLTAALSIERELGYSRKKVIAWISEWRENGDIPKI